MNEQSRRLRRVRGMMRTIKGIAIVWVALLGPSLCLGQTGYYFMVDNIHIDHTRSLGKDTDYASLTVKVGDRVLPQQTSGLGDVGNGEDHYPGLIMLPVPIRDSDTVTFNYIVVNAGHSGTSEDIRKVLDSAGDKLTSGPPDLADWKNYVGYLLKGIGFLFADCDGVVAADQISMTGAQLRDRLGTGNLYSETRSYSGSDSPTGCGSNSQYSVTFSVRGTNWTGPWEVPGGGITDAPVASTFFQNKIWLFVKGTDDRVYMNQSADALHWTGWIEVPGSGITDANLAVTNSSSRLWLFAKGRDSKIFMNYFDPSIDGWAGGGWYGWDEVAGGGLTDAALGAAYFSLGGLGNDHVFVFCKGLGANQIYYNSFQIDLAVPPGSKVGVVPGPRPLPGFIAGSRDAKKFVGWQEVPGGGLTDAAPSAFMGERPYLLVKGAGRPSVFYNPLTGGSPDTCGSWKEVFFDYPPASAGSWRGVTTSSGVRFNGQTYVLATATNGNVYFRAGSIEDPSLWRYVRWLPDSYMGTSYAPSAIVQGAMLRVFYTGPDQRIYMNSWNGVRGF